MNKRVDDGLKALREASKLGYTKAIIKLINLYENGQNGVKKDADLANKYTQMLKKIKNHK